eukprot:72899_1
MAVNPTSPMFNFDKEDGDATPTVDTTTTGDAATTDSIFKKDNEDTYTIPRNDPWAMDMFLKAIIQYGMKENDVPKGGRSLPGKRTGKSKIRRAKQRDAARRDWTTGVWPNVYVVSAEPFQKTKLM